jgi:hypothetical protein
MHVRTGTDNMGLSDGIVRVETGPQVMAAEAGHDLTLEAASRKATVTVDEEAARHRCD